MEEVLFFHKQTGTLILTDLIEKFSPNTLSWWQRKLAQFAGILSPNGKTPNLAWIVKAGQVAEFSNDGNGIDEAYPA